MNGLMRCLRHLWLDADDAQRTLGDAGIARLEARVAASERTHSGQICLCVEASLPPGYLWRHLVRRERLEDVVRDRALTLFGKQRVWDTELNNGVLVYLLLAEHRIEIVADRALARCASAQHWHALVEGIAAACRDGRIEEALAAAIDDVDAVLAAHFPRAAAGAEQGPGSGPERGLPDRPTIR